MPGLCLPTAADCRRSVPFWEHPVLLSGGILKGLLHCRNTVGQASWLAITLIGSEVNIMLRWKSQGSHIVRSCGTGGRRKDVWPQYWNSESKLSRCGVRGAGHLRPEDSGLRWLKGAGCGPPSSRGLGTTAAERCAVRESERARGREGGIHRNLHHACTPKR